MKNKEPVAAGVGVLGGSSIGSQLLKEHRCCPSDGPGHIFFLHAVLLFRHCLTLVRVPLPHVTEHPLQPDHDVQFPVPYVKTHGVKPARQALILC